MSPAAKRPPRLPPPPKAWSRAEAGRYVSVDGRFTLDSGGGGRWFITDTVALDELGLPRTSGPFGTLDAAKAAADIARERPAEASPLAGRIAKAARRPRRLRRATAAPETTAAARHRPDAGHVPAPVPAPAPEPPPRTWLDDLEATDRDGALRARRLIAALEREGITDAEAVTRRELLGDTPAVATRLLARDVLAALARLRDPSTADVAQAVAAVLASSPVRAGLPGWELLERDGPDGGRRGLRLTTDDLRAAAAAAEPDSDRNR